MTKLVLLEEGINGFYGGVVGVMIGQGTPIPIVTVLCVTMVARCLLSLSQLSYVLL